MINIKILNGRDKDWIECSYEEYNYRDRINFMYTVDEDTNEVTYYKQTVMEIYDRKE